MSLHIRTSVARLAQSQYLRRKANSEPLPLKVDPSVPEYSWAVYNGNNLVYGPYEIELGQTEKGLFGIMRGALNQAGYREPEAPPLATSQPTAPPPKRTVIAPAAPARKELPEITLDTCTENLLTLQKRTTKNFLEMGKWLTEAKRIIGHGNWLGYLKTVKFKEWQTQALMAMYREWGSNPQLIEDLGFTQLVLILGAPQEAQPELIEVAKTKNTTTLRKRIQAVRRLVRAPLVHSQSQEEPPVAEPSVIPPLESPEPPTTPQEATDPLPHSPPPEQPAEPAETAEPGKELKAPEPLAETTQPVPPEIPAPPVPPAKPPKMETPPPPPDPNQHLKEEALKVNMAFRAIHDAITSNQEPIVTATGKGIGDWIDLEIMYNLQAAMEQVVDQLRKIALDCNRQGR